MVPVAGRPLLEWMLLWLKRNQVRKVIVGVAYQPEKIMRYFGSEFMGLQIKYSKHTIDGGTVEGYRLAIERHIRNGLFFAMNGDELMNLHLQNLAIYHAIHRPIATIAVAPLPSPFGVVRLDKSNMNIIGFQEKEVIPSVLVSMGVYVFERAILKHLPKSGDIERTTFPQLAKEQKLKAYKYGGFWMNINTPKDLAEVTKRIRRSGQGFK